MRSNIEKTIKNSFISVAAQIIYMLTVFINRRIFIVFLDIEYLAYQSLFTNVFSLLSVAELGIGNIISFHLYKEIVEGNDKEIGKLMYIYKWLYRGIAIGVLVLGVCFSWLLPYYVKDATAEWSYLYWIYFLQLSSVVLGYFLSYRRTIFIAMQQEYRCVRIDLFVSILVQILQLVGLAVFRNYLLYLVMQLSTTIIANVIIAYKSGVEYPYLNKRYRIKKEDIERRNMFSDIRNFFVHQISYVIYSGTDNIIISIFCGVKSVALYGNYILVQKGVMQILFYKLLNPVQATIGNIVYGNREKDELWKQFQVLDTFCFFFASYIGFGFLIFFQPFIQMWMGEDYLLSDMFVVLLAITIYLGAVWEIVYKYRTVIGDYREDRNYMLVSALVNIFVSVYAAPKYGIEGVQFGTLVAYLPIALGRIKLVVKRFFGKSMTRYLVKHGILFLVVVAEGICCYYLVDKLPISIWGIALRVVIWMFMPGISAVCLMRNEQFRMMVEYLKNVLSIIKTKVKGESK